MRRPSRKQGWLIVDGVAAAVVVTLLVLIGLHVLVLPSRADPTVTVTSTTLYIQEGNDSFGWGWFGNSTRTFGVNDGYPFHVPSGGTFGLAFLLPIEDSVNHTALSIGAALPFRVIGSTPTLPAPVTVGDDDWQLSVVVQVPSVSDSQSYSVSLSLITE